MSSLTETQALPTTAEKPPVAAIPEHGKILDIGGSALKYSSIDKLKETLYAIAASREVPTLPDELLYDDVGLLMWNKIMTIPQFYQTHDETALFDLNSSEIIRQVPDHVTMIDLGSGDTNKVDHFLAEFERRKVHATYLALDISKTSLDESIASLTASHSSPDSVVNCGGFWGTFENGLQHMGRITGPRLFLSLGSVLCNDPWPTALGHLRRWAAELRPEDRLLIGMDGHLVAGSRDKIWTAYHSCDDMFREFFLNGLKNANKLLGYELFREKDWDFEAELEEKPTTRHRFFMRANKDVPLQEGGKMISKRQEIDWFDSHNLGQHQALNSANTLCAPGASAILSRMVTAALPALSKRIEARQCLPISPILQSFKTGFRGNLSYVVKLSDNAVSLGTVRKRSAWVANSVVTLLLARQQFPEVFNAGLLTLGKQEQAF